DRQPGYVVPGRTGLYVRGCSPDDDNQLNFPVSVAARRQSYLATRTSDARRELGKHRGSGLRLGQAGLGHVRAVVQPDPENLTRRRGRRPERFGRKRDRLRQGRRGRPVRELLPARVDRSRVSPEPAATRRVYVDGAATGDQAKPLANGRYTHESLLP